MNRITKAKLTTKTMAAAFIAAVLIALAAFAATPALAHHLFPDVPATSVHHDAIGRNHERGIAQGDQTGNYNPAAPTRRDQMGTFIDRTVKYLNGKIADAAEETLAATQVTWHKTEVALPANAATTVEATCPDGGIADAGGLDISATNGATEVRHDGPVLVNSDTPDEHIAHTWRVTVKNLSDDPGNVAAYVACVTG